MNSLIETLNRWGGRIPDFAWPMLWQSSVLIAVLFVFDFVARRKVRASIRYALWLVVLVKLLLPPTLALPTSLAWWVRPPAPQPKAQARTTAFVVTYSDFVPANFMTPAPPVFVPPPKPYLSGAGQAAATWAVVGAGLLVWLVVRWRQVAGNVRQAAVAPALLNEVLDEPQKGIKRPRRVRLLVTNRAMSPAVCGLFRPVILLPQSLVERLTPSQLRAVLLHELVHLRRGDVWVNCAQALLQIFYWWHPLLWLANARIRRVREEAVDDAVMLALRDDAETYAPTLVEVAKLAFNRPLASLGLVGIMESRSALGERIERLVDFHPPRKAGLTIVSTLCILAFAALAVPMEQAPAISGTQDSTQKQIEPTNRPPVEVSNTNEEVKLRMIVLNKPVASDAAVIRKVAEGIIAKIKGGAAFSELASVYSEGRQGREGGDWGWVQKYDRNGTLVLRKELADVAFSLKPGELSGIIETPEMIYLMLVEDKRPAPSKTLSATLPSPNSRTTTNRVFTGMGRQTIVSKLDRLRLELVSFQRLPLGEVVQLLTDESQKRDPEGKGIRFLVDPNATAVPAEPADISKVSINIDPPLSNVRLAEVLEAVVRMADKPIRYSLEEYAVVFSLRGPKVEPLSIRTFHVNPKTFYEQLEKATGVSLDQRARNTGVPTIEVLPGAALTPRAVPADLPQRPDGGGLRFITRTNLMQHVSVAVATFFGSLGVDLVSPDALALGKAVFWKDTTGTLLVRATKQDLDAIERALADFEAKPTSTTNAVVSPTSVESRESASRGNGTPSVRTTSPTSGPIGNALPKSLYENTPGPRYSVSLYFQVELREDGSYWASGKRMNLEELRDWLIKTKQSGSNTSIGFQIHSNAPPEAVRALTELRKELGTPAGSASALPASPGPEQLQTRTFKVDPNTFYKGLESVSPLHLTPTNVSVAVAAFFSTLGVDLASPSAIAHGKSVFWSDRSGVLLIRATKQDLDLIEAAVEVLNRVPPQINIKARFVEINQGDSKAFGFDWYLGDFLLANRGNTNSAAKESPQFHGILTDPQFRVVLRVLEQRDGVDLLTTPEVTTLSGRQAQIQVVDLQTVVTGVATNSTTNSLYQTQTVPIGPVLDVIPYVAADGHTIQMTVIPTVTEFLGYDEPAIYGMPPLPRFRVRQMTVTAIVRDGQTLVLGGLAATEIIKKPDGSTETKDVSATQKKHLLIFITPTLVDEAGNRLHNDDGSSPGPK